MQFKHVTLDFDGPVAILKLDHQEVMNAVSIDMLGGLAEALDAVEDNKAEVRCLVITGAGRAFCTGANLQGRNNQKPGRTNAGAALETAFHPFLRRLRNLHCPIVTAVNGPAAGAGMSFALMGDMILCARSAYFLQAFRRIGLVPDCGSTWLLPRLVGRARSIELSLMGERLPAEKALEWGLVNRVVPAEDLMAEASKIALELAHGPKALGLIRRAKDEGLAVTCDTAPPYFDLNETAIGNFRTYAKLSPPLRTEADRQAVVAALADGTIDAVASDHQPRDADDKRLPFAQAAAGGVGLATLLAVTLAQVHGGTLPLVRALHLLTVGPARLLGAAAGTLAKGAPADLCLFDLEAAWRVEDGKLPGKAQNTPFDGRALEGRVTGTWKAGRRVFG